MRNLILGIPLLALALAGGSASAVQLSGETAPVILSTETDGSGGVMTIVGRNFGDQAPTVTLAERPVLVQASTPTQLTVRLPKNIRTATYLVTVSTADGKSASGAFYAVQQTVSGL